MTPEELVKALRSSAHAYYNTGEASMSDETYDALRDQLEELDPENPFLKEVGAPPKDKAVVLPFMMASLNKIKPGTGAVDAFTKKAKGQTWVLSEKLDGISALWYNGRLYLRGDGVNGVDVTSYGKYIQGIAATSYAVRGELVLPRGVIAGTLARSWVNGQLHQKIPIPEELRKIRFVAYEIVNTTELPWLQFNILKKAGFEIPWISVASEKFMNDENLGKVLIERREKSIYDTDGIVVCENVAPPLSKQTTLKNPTYKVAFKMLLTDQCAETTIQEIEWNPSAQGFLIPRIRIEPVVVGTARIEYVTGHNARFVVDNKLGIGARIVIRRSGDVIPAVQRVVLPCTQPLMPTQDKWKWKWQNNDTSAAHIVLNEDVLTKEVLAARLVIFAKTLDIAGLGPGVAVKLVDAGLDTLVKVWKADGETLGKVIGKGNGAKITQQLSTLKPTESQLMVASSLLPRGVGELKLKTLFDSEPDARKWKALPVLAGWSADTLDELKASMGPYEEWRRTELTQFPYPILPSPVSKEVKPLKGTLCFTGVRSKELEAVLESAGWKIVDTVSSKLTVLIVADGEANAMTGKAKKARDLGTVRILELSQAKAALSLDGGV
jgi:DNA ligase (NAD+)